MKKLLILLLLSPLLSFSQQNNSAGTAEPLFKNAIKLSFDGFFFGRYEMSYERVLGRYTSMNLTFGGLLDLSKTQNSVGSAYSNEHRLTGFTASPEFRVYMSEFTNSRIPTGFYFGTSARYRQSKTYDRRVDEYSVYEANEDEQTIGLGLCAGLQYVTSFGLGFDMFIGPNFRYRFTDRESSEIFQSPVMNSNRTISSMIEQETVPFAGVNITYAF